MPSVTARSKGVWRITIELGHDPTTGRRKRMVRDIRGSKKEAQAELARLMHQRRTGEYVEPHKQTVAGFLDRWLAYMSGRLAPSAHTSYSYVVRLRLSPALGSISLLQLQPAHIAEAERQWLTAGRVGPARMKYGRGLAPKTVVNYHRVLRAALQHAVRWNLLRFNPCDQMEPPRWERTEQHVLSLEEVRALLEVLQHDRHGVALHALLATGLRVGELLGLRWREDIDLDAGVIRVQQQYDRVTKTFRDTKTHRSKRPVAIDLELIAALRHHRAAQAERQLNAGSMWQATGLVFTDNLGGHLDHDMLRKALARCLRTAGLEPVNPHGLRHTHASLMIALGTHMRVLQERLGHASYAITADTYSHVNATAQHEAATLLGNALKRKGVEG